MHSSSFDSGLLSITQITAMLYARRRLVVVVAFTLLQGTLCAVLFMPKSWTASADLYIDYKENDPIAGRAFSAMLDDSYMQTQIAMIRSPIVAERVVDKLGLRRTEKFQEAVASGGEARAYEQLIKSLKENTETSSARGSRVVTVSYTAASPAAARDTADAIIAAYVDISQKIASSSARSRSEQYQLQLEQLRGEAETLQQKITAYQRETGILNEPDNSEIELRQVGDMVGSMTQLDARQQALKSKAQVTEQLVRNGTRAEDLPDIAVLPPVADLKARINDVERRLENVQGVLGDRHPTVLGLRAERSELRARLQRTANAALGAQRNELDAAVLQRAALQEAIGTQRTSVLEKMQHRDQLSAYRRQLASAEQVYNAALQKYDNILMASNITQLNLTVLRAAELPSRPSRPLVRQSVVLGAIIGLLAGLCLALLLELRHRRVRCIDDLVRGVPLPLLGHVGKPDLNIAT